MDTRSILTNAAHFLMEHADELDRMALESRRGGWSTHQTDRQKQQAIEMRAKAGELYVAATDMGLPL